VQVDTENLIYTGCERVNMSEPKGYPPWMYELPMDFWVDKSVLDFIDKWKKKRAHQEYRNLQTLNRIRNGR